jgi:hypothetical protein
MNEYAKKRLAELRAAAPVKRKKTEPFVKVPMWWIEAAAKATESPTTLVLIELLRLHWKTKRSTFSVPNGRLRKLGVSRKVKHRVLRELEQGQGRLIVVKRKPRKAPTVTLVAL